MKKLFIAALPNLFPYNNLLFDGLLVAKTRSWKWSHTGLTLLYTSSGKVRSVMSAYGYEAEEHAKEFGALAGFGYLQPVRENTNQEIREIEKVLNKGKSYNHIYAGRFRYEFKNLQQFTTPIPYVWKPGNPRTAKVPASLVVKQLAEFGIKL